MMQCSLGVCVRIFTCKSEKLTYSVCQSSCVAPGDRFAPHVFHISCTNEPMIVNSMVVFSVVNTKHLK